MEEKIKQTNPTLHKYLFTVTTFSKLLAMLLFILLPFVGFYLGMKYQQKVTVTTPVASEIQKTVSPKPMPTTTPSSTLNPINTLGWKTYVNSIFGYSYLYPSDGKITENGSYSVDGVFVSAPDTTSLAGGSFQLTISVKKNTNNLTFDDLKKVNTDPKGINGGKIDILTIGGENAVGTVAGGPFGAYSIQTIHNGYAYTLFFEPGLSSTAKELLDSFKFTK